MFQAPGRGRTQPDRLGGVAGGPPRTSHTATRATRRIELAGGQILVLFVLFLVILLGIGALAIDYATWLLTDRSLQNTSDHAALAGASAFQDSSTANDCSGTKCVLARAQAWTALSNDLGLGLTPAAVSALATADSPAGGQPNGTYGGQNVIFPDRLWVATPPPNYGAYEDVGGRYTFNHGVIFVRVDRAVPSFLGGALGLQPDPRHGWATAGVQSMDFALQIWCSTAVDPSCGGSGQAALVIDGGGGIRLLRGSIASNESLKVTQQGGQGVILENGDMFVVRGDCSSATWNCPQIPSVPGGIADDNPLAVPNVANNKNAFYIPPQPVVQYASPDDIATEHDTNCAGAGPAPDLCVPYRPQGATSPGDWSCSATDLNNLCGQPCAYVPAAPSCVDPATLTSADLGFGTIRCEARIGGTPNRHLVPWSDGSGASGFHESPDQANNEDYKVLDDDAGVPDPDTTATNPPTDFVYTNGTLGVSGGSAAQIVTYNLRPPFGIPQNNATTIRYVAFKTDGTSASSDTGNVVSVSATLLQGGAAVSGGSEPPDAHTLTGAPQLFSFTVPAGQITNYTDLSVRLTYHTVSGDNSNRRGGALAWLEAETPDLDPALPPMVAPGYYRSITIADDGCAILDPSAVYSGLKGYQLPGIYRFGGGAAKLELGDGAYLIGDGVSLVFDSNFPNATGSAGLILGVDSALVLNTGVTANVAGATPCTPHTEGPDYNPSTPLIPLPYSSLCASWGIDAGASSGIRAGANAWPVCIPDPVSGDVSLCRSRALYNPTSGYRGITFYFTPPAWNPSSIRNRYQMQGTDAGMAFRGVLYAPYDDIRISGRNGFNTVGQVLVWTAKFNGGSASIDLDYPYDFTPSSPFLLEPTVDH